MKTSNPVSDTGVAPLPSPTLTASLAALDDFRMTHPKEIINVLRQLARRQDFMTVAFGRHGERIVTRILAVDDNTGSFFYDYGASAAENQAA